MEIYVNLILFATSFAYCRFFWIVTHLHVMRNVLISHSRQQQLGKYLGEQDAFKLFLSFLSTLALTCDPVLDQEHSSVELIHSGALTL